MDNWRKVFPGAIHEISYEKLVADQEEESRKLLDYCGLEWEEGCLDFHKTVREIRTASNTQVRQPIHSRSVARWRNVADQLHPLRDALGDLASPD